MPDVETHVWNGRYVFRVGVPEDVTKAGSVVEADAMHRHVCSHVRKNGNTDVMLRENALDA